MYNQVDESVHIPYPRGLGGGHQYRPKRNSRSSSSAWLHNTTIVPQEEEERPDHSSLPPAEPARNAIEARGKRRSRVDSGVSVSNPSNLFKSSHPKRSKSPAASGVGTATAKSSVWSMAIVSAYSASTAPSDTAPKYPSPRTSNEATPQGISDETRLARFRRESQASQKLIDDKIKAHRGKERARNRRAEEMLRATKEHKKITEKRLKQAVRENTITDQGNRRQRFKRWFQAA
ncbi:hypothetical protein HYFRA_00006383 [Hymenoscyphus fraxineus]|uniref:Uncharacterized protein n=1 Tax=Hymenoscyphus fraxineus TaxID=746836 RepID=A0A9N9KPY6_9HELO|nr:hypothetical protein HYFRA_00006383 [Hymenoscyphus fraxineus]